jgi:hypothetical protein
MQMSERTLNQTPVVSASVDPVLLLQQKQASLLQLLGYSSETSLSAMPEREAIAFYQC